MQVLLSHRKADQDHCVSFSGCYNPTSREGRHNQLSLSPFIINEVCLWATLKLSKVELKAGASL